jgi:hypothetical protein
MKQENNYSGEIYRWEHVNASRNDKNLQKQYSLEEAMNDYLKKASPCPKCKLSPEKLSWFYFITPLRYWKHRSGRAGWITVCDQCNYQVDFFSEIMN